MERANERLARHYEEEAEATRHSLANTLTDLRAHLTPGQMFNEVMSYTRGGSGTLGRAFSNAVRENPFPALLIGTGCMLFLSERMGWGQRSDRTRQLAGYEEDQTTYRDREVEDRRARDDVGIATSVKQKAAGVAESVKESLSSVGEKLSDVSDRARETATGIGEGASNVVEHARQRADSVRERLTDTAIHAAEQARDAGQQIKEKTSTYVHEQPLIMAGLALAVGAAIAALLPSTRMENKLMGRTADSVKRKIGETAEQQFETAKETAGELVQKARDVADREGLTPRAAAAELKRKLGDGQEEQPFDAAGQQHRNNEPDVPKI